MHIILRAPGTSKSPGITACPKITAPRTFYSFRSKYLKTLISPGNKLGKR
jgi:hypothetical protein